jgi:arylsulfatase A-like enzyme
LGFVSDLKSGAFMECKPKFQPLMLLLVSASILFAQKQDRPNILLIMADDMGYEVPGYTGGTSYNTPHIDQLAKTGMQFTHCYSTPKCAPSRVTIMTGRYLFRTTEKWGHIPPDEITFGHLLQEAGYKVALAGKWQMALLGEDPLHVRKMGFEQFCVFGWHEGPRYHDPYIWQNGELLENTKGLYGPDIYVDFLIDFMTENKDKPFLAYYPMALAHDVSNDFEPPPPPGPDGRYQSYAQLIAYMDKNIGKLVTALDRLALREKTLILFTADNGTPQRVITDIKNGEYMRKPIVSKWGNIAIPGGKATMTDRGTHVPMIANWPGTVPAGKMCPDLIDFTDFLPTLVELSASDLPDDRIIDGRSFVKQLDGATAKPRMWIYNQFKDAFWIRNQRWKLYSDGRLYDMSSDPFELMPVMASMDGPSAAEVRKFFNEELHALKSQN